MKRRTKIAFGVIAAAILADARFGTFNGSAVGLVRETTGFNIGMPPKDRRGVASSAGANPEGVVATEGN